MHTPTPWKINQEWQDSLPMNKDDENHPDLEYENEHGDILGPNGEHIAEMILQEEDDFYKTDQAYLNAALIVKAVNSYEAMKEALESVPLPSSHGTPADYYQRIYNWLPMAQKALALAEEKE
jgi:hypothetical protein